MKNYLFALMLVFAAIGACNPPQSTTGTSSDSTVNRNNDNNNNNNRDTSTMQKDTSMRNPRDTSMHK